MVVLLAGLLIVIILLLQVTFRIDVQHAAQTTSCVTVKYAFISRTWQSGQKSRGSTRRKRRLGILRILREEARSRRFIRRHIRLDALDALILLHTGDAARTALLSGTLQNLAGIPAIYLGKARIRVLPDFYQGHTTLQTRCIFHIRLGILLLTMLMLLASRLQRKARTVYGTSHW